ncbi:LysR family transcriptional regulator [Desulfosediminicola sp.]|uniref:LysR family transcriptional regulator n=1 Tax=Desulfosediminicola sp. TaxID=2886825 RepID=UPI003AF1EAF4
MHNKANWDDYLYFLRVARLGSLSAASKSLQVNHSTVLRRINSLEEKLEARLFERLNSGYVLTQSGKEILSRVDHIEGEFLAIERTISGRDIRYEGKIKLSTTDTLGEYWLPPYVKKFKELQPGIQLDIDIRTDYTDLTKREADIALVAVNRHPEYVVGKSLAPIRLKLYATREYIQTHGKPTSHEQLAEHRILILNERLGRIGFNEWLKNLVPKSAIALSCNMLTTLYHYTHQGLGIAPLPTYVGDQDKDLVAVLDVPEKFHHKIWMLTHPDLRNTMRIKAFMQFMYNETAVKGKSASR